MSGYTPMRARPVRPNIYLPVVRFGVADSDWFSVLLISCAGYLVAIPLGITVLYVPLQMWTWLIVTAGSIAFFNYIRIGKRPYWLQHQMRAVVFHHRQCRAIPNGKKRPFKPNWLIDSPAMETSSRPSAPESKPKEVALLLDYHNQLQEDSSQRWNDSLVSMN